MRFDNLRSDALKLGVEVDLVDLDYSSYDDYEVVECGVVWDMDVTVSGSGIARISPSVSSMSLSVIKKVFNEDGPDSEEIETIAFGIDNINTMLEIKSTGYTSGSTDMMINNINVSLKDKNADIIFSFA